MMWECLQAKLRYVIILRLGVGCYIEELFFSPDIYYVVPFGTYLNCAEDVDILVEFYVMCILLELVGFCLFCLI